MSNIVQNLSPVNEIVQRVRRDFSLRQQHRPRPRCPSVVKEQSRSWPYSRQLQAGTIRVNAHAEMDPGLTFGGFKSSVIGARHGVEGLKGHCNLQTMYIKLV
ncbi:hypothetical protein GGS26DRAFT_319136 [Hypomontagnella submonticulosa]|nr:hypothetical protein GGS26DRAFT_319136 [Hypomontagnella submonticulosa]